MEHQAADFILTYGRQSVIEIDSQELEDAHKDAERLFDYITAIHQEGPRFILESKYPSVGLYSKAMTLQQLLHPLLIPHRRIKSSQ